MYYTSCLPQSLSHGQYFRCEITVRHGATCPTNLAQCPIEKWFLLLNGHPMPVENLFVVKPEQSPENSIYLLIF